MRSIRFTEKTLTRALTAGVLMGSLFLPFSAGAASPERTAESKSVPAATVSAQEKVSQEKIVKENLKIAGTALMCAGTYSMGEGSSEHSLFSDYGWDVSPFRAASDDTDVHFAVAVSKKAYGRTYPTILAFRGSQTKTDWKTNFRASLVPFDEKNKTADPKTVPSVHEGFERYAATVLRTPMDLDGDGKEEMVAPYLKQHPDRRLYLTGHSLGGAVASLVAERLVEKGVPKAQVPVITFGAPAVGNKAFADVYGKRIDLIRVVTSLDPVPGSLQTFFGGDFTQFGKVVKFNLSKNYSGYQHPVSFYLDLALRRFYDSYDEAVKMGLLQKVPLAQEQGKKPMSALALYTTEDSFDDRFSPDLGRFVLDDYRAMLPRYTVLDVKHEKEDNFRIEEGTLMKAAQKAGASYLIIVTLDIKRLGQSRAFYITLSQHVRSLEGPGLSTLTMGSTCVSFDQGLTQATLSLLEDQKAVIRNLLPFIRTEERLWNLTPGDDTSENH